MLDGKIKTDKIKVKIVIYENKIIKHQFWKWEQESKTPTIK